MVWSLKACYNSVSGLVTEGVLQQSASGLVTEGMLQQCKCSGH